MPIDNWREEINFALTAPLKELVLDSIKVSGTLDKDRLDKITAEDVEALEVWGLPTTDTIELRPSIEAAIQHHYLIGSSYELGRLRGAKLFVRPRHGRVLKVTDQDEHGIRYGFVNSSIKQFVELTWRYHHLSPIRIRIMEAWETVGVEAEEKAVAAIWQWATAFDPLVDIDEALSFWDATIRGLA